ncbi:hypothetical protein [Kribbella sp. NPDC051718]|uniref:hypothetical protein n=1 Tax=Kribbella sp. NPDC051718 TaxID=3155168 RepID=UPI00343AFFC2
MADRFDLDAIEADDALLDLLAAGGESAWQAGEHDPALKLLADLRLAVEVEGELPVESIDDPESFLARCAALNPVTDPFARKLAARGLALGVAAVAALSVSGVAAAVTGNPLSPYEKVIEKIADGLRPETSLPKEQLDGLPAFDKTKIVRVAKNYKESQEEARTGQKAKDSQDDGNPEQPAAAVELPLQPPLALPQKQTTQQLQIETPVSQPPADPKPADPEPSDGNPPAPVDPKPTDAPSQPTTEPSGDPTGEPTEQPSTPETPPPSETTPSTPPSTPPTDNGSTGNPGENPGDNPGTTPSAPVTVPTTLPSNGNGETSTGTDSDDNGTPPASDNGGDNQTAPGGQTGDDSGDQSGDSKGEVPTGGLPVELPAGQVGDQSGDAEGDPISEVVESVLPVLPTPTGAPVEEPARMAQYFGKGFTGHGKHSSGKPALGYAKSQYAKGKHSTGHYAEGRHAAITRAHGSMAPVTIRQILGVLNTPMSDR